LIELRHLRAFVAVAEELHFGNAASRLEMAQPALSKQIARLERELGARLLNRTRRRVDLTDAGRLFLEEARLTLAQAERTVQTARRIGRGELGQLQVAFGPTAELGLLPEVLPAFLSRYPAVELDLRSLYAADQSALLKRSPNAVGLTLLPLPDHDGLHVEMLYAEPLLAALPQQHPLAAQSEIPLSALADQPMVMFPRRLGPGLHDRIVSAFRELGAAPNFQHDASHLYTNLGLVAAGLGVSLLPHSIRCLSRSGVVYRRLSPPAPQIELGLAHRASDAAPVVLKFAEAVRMVIRARTVPKLAAVPTAARRRSR
jgi:DNA-binding transcriptional LysR family regulator